MLKGELSFRFLAIIIFVFSSGFLTPSICSFAILHTSYRRFNDFWFLGNNHEPLKQNNGAHMEVSSIKPTISFNDFEKLDIRIGTIERVEDIRNSNKLVRLIVEFGDHERKILAGIKRERTDPTEIEGKQALFVVNLEPRKMMGELSEGMLFDIGYADGITPVLAVPEKPVPNGSRAG